jgi:hypothetical protein
MDGMPALPIHVLVYVMHDLQVVYVTVGPKDGLSNGMVDASLVAHAKVSQRGGVRPADSSIDRSSRICARLSSARVNRGTAGVREATLGRRLRVRVVQHQKDRLDAW